MKYLFIFIILTFGLQVSLQAQDVLLKKNGQELRVKIKEINASEVIFNYFDSTNLALFMIPKSEVFYIKYANGVKEIISAIQNDPKISDNAKNPNKIKIEGAKYYLNEERLSISQLEDLFIKSDNKQAIESFNMAMQFKRYGYIGIYVGIGFCAMGTVLSQYDDPFLFLIPIGGAFLGTGFFIKGRFNKHVREAIGYYNKGLKY